MSGARQAAGPERGRPRAASAHHEPPAASEEIRLPSDRAVGLVFAGAGAVVGLAPALAGHPVRWWGLALAAGFAAVACLRPAALAPLNRAWMRLGAVLNRVTTLVVLAIVFFGVVTPTAILLRLLGKDVLGLRRDPRVPTYWTERVPPGPPPEAMANQF
jgi:hypothetical protein